MRGEALVLACLQALVLALPWLRGGRTAGAVLVAGVLVVALLAVTVRARRRHGGPAAPGLGPLAGFVALALATTLPLAPAALAVLSPHAAALATAMLPGWPDAGGWARWRPLALDPSAAWGELGRLSIGFGAFGVIVGYPWRQARPVDGLVVALVAAGVLTASLGLAQPLGGAALLGGLLPASRQGRASGPFVNPNHFATALEMVIPLGLAVLLAVCRRLSERVRRIANAKRAAGLRAGQAWVAAVTAHQGPLVVPLAAALALLVMGLAHAATGSRGGTAALLVGLGVAGVAMAARTPRRWSPAARAAVAAGALGLVLAGGGVLVRWADADGGRDAALDAVDASLASRLQVTRQGVAVVREYPLVGAGLGSWLHAFRPHQSPPIDGGIWDHAHDDYLELAAETGVAGLGLAALFALAVLRAGLGAGADAPAGAEHHGPWRAAVGDRALLRAGLVGGVAAVAVHALVDFGLHLPANLLGLMVLLALLVLTGRPRPERAAPALVLLSVLLGVVVALPVASRALGASGRLPLSPAECLLQADRVLGERGDAGRAEALRLVRHALERAPASRAAHEAYADALGSGPEGDAALRRALVLEPWAIEVRDRLALRLWARGERAAAAAELEESLARVPYLLSHAFLAPEAALGAGDVAQLRRAVLEGVTLRTRIAALEPELADAIDRGLARALYAVPAGEGRTTTLGDLATLREARGAWASAALLLRREATYGADTGAHLARAAGDLLAAEDRAGAEEVLLAALLETPERGELYRRLAVDVYAARGDFATAERVLQTGERQATDVLPVYQGITQLLARRESRRPGATMPAVEGEP